MPGTTLRMRKVVPGTFLRAYAGWVETEIRRAGTADLDAVVELVGGYCAADGHDFDRDLAVAGLVPLLTDDRFGMVLVACADGAPVGYAVIAFGWSIECGGREAVLDELFVGPKDAGIGTRLVAAAEAECVSAGVLRIFLETEAANESARRLYRRLGFHTETSIWMSKLL